MGTLVNVFWGERTPGGGGAPHPNIDGFGRPRQIAGNTQSTSTPPDLKIFGRGPNLNLYGFTPFCSVRIFNNASWAVPGYFWMFERELTLLLNRRVMDSRMSIWYSTAITIEGLFTTRAFTPQATIGIRFDNLHGGPDNRIAAPNISASGKVTMPIVAATDPGHFI